MKLLYSNILPLGNEVGQQSIIDCFIEQLSRADKLEIAVGYISCASIMELDSLIEKHKIKNVCLVVGMYYLEGMPENTYHTALKLHKNGVKMELVKLNL